MTDGEAFSEQLAQSVSKQISDISLSGTVPVKNQIADGTYSFGLPANRKVCFSIRQHE